MLGPWHHKLREPQTGPCLEAIQAALFDQLVAKTAELEAGSVVAEARSGDHAEPYIGDTGSVAMPTLEAETHGPTAGHGK